MRRGFQLLLLGICLAYWASTPVRADAPDEEHEYVGVAKCKTCHGKELMGDQHATWLAAPHARAFESLKSEHSLAIAAEQGLVQPPHEAGECLTCHTTSYTVDPALVAYDMEPEDGVQCESCHGAGRDYRKKKIMSDREQALAKGLLDVGKRPELCEICHNSDSPTFDPKRYTLEGGSTAGFHFEQAKQRILHPIPEDVKGRYIELDEKQKAERKARGED